jgi:GR25 family glycosyltransferase involved in LPS biosynthesis
MNKAYIISLSRIKESAESSQKVLKQLKEYGFDAELFEGTYGFDAPDLFKKEQRRIATYGIKGSVVHRDQFAEKFPGYNFPPSTISITVREELVDMGKTMRPGVLGCFYSHYRLWQKCVELDRPIFIFEDDVIFERGYLPVVWDEVLLLCLGKEAHKHEYYGKLLYAPEGAPQAVAMRNASMPGAVGYGLTPKGAKKLVEAYKTEFLPADTAMNTFVVNIECHSHLMGRAATSEDGKRSLTATKIWGKNKE